MATQTNPKISCSFCKKLLTQRHFFHHLHTSHHSDLWTASNKKMLEKAIAKDAISDILLEIKGYDNLFYLSPFSQRLYTKLAAAKNDYKKHNNDRVKYKSLLTSLLSSSPVEKKVTTQVSQIAPPAPEDKDEVLALKKLLAIMAKELMLERRDSAEKDCIIAAYKEKMIEQGMTEEEVDDLEPLSNEAPEEFNYKTDMLTKKHAQYVKSFDLSSLAEIEKVKYSSLAETVSQPSGKQEEVTLQTPDPSVSPAPVDIAPEPSAQQDLPPPPAPKPVEELPVPVPTPAKPDALEETPQPPKPLVKKPPKQATSAAHLTASPYTQFVYRDPVPQFPKILSHTKR